MNQDEDEDNAGKFDNEVPQYDFAELFQSLKKPGNIEENSDDVQCLVPINQMIAGKAGNNEVIDTQAQSHQKEADTIHLIKSTALEMWIILLIGDFSLCIVGNPERSQ